jgi:hypothetical protein
MEKHVTLKFPCWNIEARLILKYVTTQGYKRQWSYFGLTLLDIYYALKAIGCEDLPSPPSGRNGPTGSGLDIQIL